MKIVINNCFGGFGISDEGYEKLIEWGVPVRKYTDRERDDERVIFDRELTPQGEDIFNDFYWKYKGKASINQRYWETWFDNNRSDDLLIRLVEELGDRASGQFGELKIVEIPDGVEWEIDEYDGLEHIAEKHRTWG